MPHSTSCVSENVLLCLILPPVFQQRYFCASFYPMWLISVPVFQQRYFCHLILPHVAHITSCVSAKVLLCLILPYPCGSAEVLCASFYLLCFRKGTSVPHSTSCVSAKVLLCLILPHVAHITSCVSAKVLLCLILPHVFQFQKVLLCILMAHLLCFRYFKCGYRFLLCLILPPVFQQRYFCASFYLLCFRKGTSVPHALPPCVSALLCLILPPVFQQKYFCASLLCLLPPVFQQRYFCASFYPCFSKSGSYHFLCFSKGISHTPSILSGTFLQTLPDLVLTLRASLSGTLPPNSAQI